ncbi:MAG: 6-bladed beta-propeller [Kiritimatiellaeota bacterium]|nr:6-bladed beta-propeller [Kiritimatiellota bacterium]
MRMDWSIDGRALGRLTLSLAAAITAGCVTTPPLSDPNAQQPTPVWPPPPAAARVTYVRSVGVPADLGMRLSLWGRLLGVISGGGRIHEGFVKPFGLCLDEDNNLCVTDTGAPAVWFFDRRRMRFRRWGKVGPFGFVSPVAVAKKHGLFYVADSGLGKVLVFGMEGDLRFMIEHGVQRPTGLAIAGERLYVADAGTHCVAVFGLDGELLFKFGRRGVGNGEFNFPTHVSADAAGRIYVTDSLNARVQVFDAEGKFQGLIGGLGDGSGHFSRPKGVAVDHFGHVYVTDALFDNLQVFDSQGRFLLDVGSAGQSAGEFWMPAGVAVGRDDFIYVADSYNRRVQILRYLEKK